jgi:hypothetical protein
MPPWTGRKQHIETNKGRHSRHYGSFRWLILSSDIPVKRENKWICGRVRQSGCQPTTSTVWLGQLGQRRS